MPLAPGDMLLIAAALAVIAVLADLISRRLVRLWRKAELIRTRLVRLCRRARTRRWLAAQQAADRKRLEGRRAPRPARPARPDPARRWLYAEWLAVYQAADREQPERVAH